MPNLTTRRRKFEREGARIVTSGKDDEEFFRQRGFGIKIGFGERPALIIST